MDAVVDAHPIILDARIRAPREGRRYVGIALDLVWDHFVARDGINDDYNQALIQRCYRLLDERPAPARLEHMVPILIAQDWLNGYADFGFTCSAVAGIGRRLSGPNRLAGLVPWLEADYQELEQDFARLWPDLNRQLGI